MIDVGVVLPTRLRPSPLSPAAVLRIAETAEQEGGFDHVWVTDSVISLPFYDSVVLLAASRRARLGYGSVSPARRASDYATRSSSPNSGPIWTFFRKDA